MTAYEADRVKKAAYAGLMLKEIAQKLGRSITTIWYWLQKLNVHQVWSIARRMIMYKVVKVGHRKTYLEGERDLGIGKVRLQLDFNGDSSHASGPNPRLGRGELGLGLRAMYRKRANVGPNLGTNERRSLTWWAYRGSAKQWTDRVAEA